MTDYSTLERNFHETMRLKEERLARIYEDNQKRVLTRLVPPTNSQRIDESNVQSRIPVLFRPKFEITSETVNSEELNRTFTLRRNEPLTSLLTAQVAQDPVTDHLNDFENWQRQQNAARATRPRLDPLQGFDQRQPNTAPNPIRPLPLQETRRTRTGQLSTRFQQGAQPPEEVQERDADRLRIYTDEEESDDDEFYSGGTSLSLIHNKEKQLLAEIQRKQTELDAVSRRRRQMESENKTIPRYSKVSQMKTAIRKPFKILSSDEEDDEKTDQRQHSIKMSSGPGHDESTRIRTLEGGSRPSAKVGNVQKPLQRENRRQNHHESSHRPVVNDDKPLGSFERGRTFQNETTTSATADPHDSKSVNAGTREQSEQQVPPHQQRITQQKGLTSDLENQEEYSTNSTNLVPCENCGRKFAGDRIEKHEKACSSQKRRKVFNMTKQRVEGTDAKNFVEKGPSQQRNQAPGKKKDWRSAREDFIQSVRYARKVAAVEKTGGDLSSLPPPPAARNDHYVQCPHCTRRFAPSAAERHIPKCAGIKSRAPPPPPNKQVRGPDPNAQRRKR